MAVKYMLGNHLGSTSITTDANGAKVSEMRYREASLWDKPWGEVRSWWTASLSTTPAYKLADYTLRQAQGGALTGQFSYMDDPSTSSVTEGFGLMFYREASLWDNARWYDPALGRFAQADTIVPSYTNPQHLNRYMYVVGNPMRYNDPTGHVEACNPNDGDICEHDDSGGGSKPKPKPKPKGGDNCNNDPSCKIASDGDNYDWGGGYTTPDIPGRCDRPHCYDERRPVPPLIDISWKPWEEIDKIDLAVDIFGITGDLALLVGGPFAVGYWFITEAPEFLLLGKAFDQVELGDSTAAVQIVVDTLGAGVDAARLAPWGGAIANLVSIGLNITEIEINLP